MAHFDQTNGGELMKITDLPFNQHIGLEKDDQGVVLHSQPHLLNHVGTLHATAIYGLAEAASGDFIIANLLPLFPDATALARSGSIQYKRPATTDCRGNADVGAQELKACIDSLKESGRAKLPVPVKMESEGKVIATAEFQWWFSLK